MHGDEDDDLIEGGPDADIMDGGDGVDTLYRTLENNTITEMSTVEYTTCKKVITFEANNLALAA
jgi:Ca2+-binding RTX toxin-like protein